MRSLITGGRGFVGQWLAAHLRELGDEVTVIDVEVDVTDPVALLAALTDAAPDAIYHLAAMTHVGKSWDEPLKVLQVNVMGTAVLLAAARQCGSDPGSSSPARRRSTGRSPTRPSCRCARTRPPPP